MTAPDDARRVADALTKAQRRTLTEDQGCDYVYARRLRTMHALSAANLVTTGGDWSLKGYFTPLGLAVRAALNREGKAG